MPGASATEHLQTIGEQLSTRPPFQTNKQPNPALFCCPASHKEHTPTGPTQAASVSRSARTSNPNQPESGERVTDTRPLSWPLQTACLVQDTLPSSARPARFIILHEEPFHAERPRALMTPVCKPSCPTPLVCLLITQREEREWETNRSE